MVILDQIKEIYSHFHMEYTYENIKKVRDL